jgi:hypothetical protein
MLSKEEIQSSYNDEQKNISTFSGKLSESCKYAWAGALALFFTSIVAANAETLARFKSVFDLLWIAAFFGALAFLLEIFQYIAAYVHARTFTAWMAAQTEIAKGDHDKKAYGPLTKANFILFVLKVICSLLSAAFVALGMVSIACRHG